MRPRVALLTGGLVGQRKQLVLNQDQRLHRVVQRQIMLV
jgi:hypothetical protein